jgi:hypothetical protein
VRSLDNPFPGTELEHGFPQVPVNGFTLRLLGWEASIMAFAFRGVFRFVRLLGWYDGAAEDACVLLLVFIGLNGVEFTAVLAPDVDWVGHPSHSHADREK